MTVYLDHAATTPLRPEALSAMLPYLTEHFGNPSGVHSVARRARRAVDDARQTVADCLGCEPGDVVFTSGGTEGANLAIRGALAVSPGAVVCSAIEHDAVRRTCAAVGGTIVGVDGAGRTDVDALARALHPGVSVVSVMLANNEVGTVQPLADVVATVRAGAPQALVHTDAVAAVGWLDVADLASDADLLSVSAHKFGGPKGSGALVARGGARLAAVTQGGPQERGRRPGTHDVAGIVGMAAALRIATDRRGDDVRRIARLRDRLADGLRAAIPDVAETGVRTVGAAPDRGGKTAGSCHVVIAGVEQEEVLVLLDDVDICASGGAACASGALDASHVLLAMGVPGAAARSALRLSLGWTTTDADVDVVLAELPKVVEQLRR